MADTEQDAGTQLPAVAGGGAAYAAPLNPYVAGIAGLSIPRQVGVIVGLAASVALAVWLVLWTQGADMRPLYGSMENLDAAAVVGVLESNRIRYRIDESSGALLVESSRFHDARLLLAEAGMPNQRAVGFEMLDKEQGIGTSQFMETARYRHSLEGELARTIGSIASVRAARVHLAMPERSAFVRDRAPAQRLGAARTAARANAAGRAGARHRQPRRLQRAGSRSGGRHHRGPEGQAGIEFRRRPRGGGRHPAARVHRQARGAAGAARAPHPRSHRRRRPLQGRGDGRCGFHRGRADRRDLQPRSSRDPQRAAPRGAARPRRCRRGHSGRAEQPAPGPGRRTRGGDCRSRPGSPLHRRRRATCAPSRRGTSRSTAR